MKYSQVKVRVTNQEDKKTTELYMVNAVSVTDAEAIIYKHLEGVDMQVTSVTETKVLDVI